MNLLIDAQLPPRLAEWLRANGCQATAVRDLGLRDAVDKEIWDFAVTQNCIIVTKDEDFAEMATRLNEGPAVLWVRCGNVLNRELLGRFAEAWPTARRLLEDGAKVVELR
jgi:predicted nuclease of predicted toxin-antitoxin system